MQELFSVCKTIVKEYAEYEQTDSDLDVARCLSKMKKALQVLEGDDETLNKSIAKFRQTYKKLDEHWYSRPVIFVLYKDEKLVKGPALHLSKIYKMSSKVDRRNKSNLKTQLSESLFLLLQNEPDLKIIESILIKADKDHASDIKRLVENKDFINLFSLVSKQVYRKREEGSLKDIFEDQEVLQLLDKVV
ncbi:hypothetical protein BQ9231_00504 [Cedratvirus lausannensis]|uniref:Uncharacterized protein n=1 Tax=Cedratvirus lausannensis TaxID=2023205 RepID=A0A285PYR9_9VIRU|nr:hypothetical protein Cbor_130 [Cedratvirus borely]WIL03494.1 hypothetical protein Cplu_125 [Cedratvirus plubellavi]SOB74387.1 hypothetical protein BQ9231_00504 [Cedratvirus lausannensis]